MSRHLAESLATFLARRTSRRSLLARTAVVGAALATDPVTYVLRPVSAYRTVCGEGASCASGWTAFCVTVNDGVNQCPPGSFVAGWWKADRASVCGGGARYYVDCNAECVHGRPGRYTCGCRCAPGHTCDQRHTCCNQFRYGQCNQHIACYGPVVCRTVSCVPPWKWANCSTVAATDNRTRSHSAPELPHHWDAVERRYVHLHGHASPLGASVGRRHRVGHGLVQNYQHGLLAWSPDTRAAMLRTRVAHAYHRLGGPGGALGFPTHDERPARSGHGRLARFRHGALFVHGEVTAHAFAGPLLDRWTRLADTAVPLGQPAGNAHAAHDDHGRVARFRHGWLLWSAATGAHAVQGAAAERYVSLGRERSALGYPTADTVDVPDGTLTRFEHGGIVAGPGTGAWDLSAQTLAYWETGGGVRGPLGFPTGATAAAPRADGAAPAAVTPFQAGVVYWSADLGAHAVRPPILAAYDGAGGSGGPLGLPTADAAPTGGPSTTGEPGSATTSTTSTQPFEHGTITYDPATQTRTVGYTDDPPPPASA